MTISFSIPIDLDEHAEGFKTALTKYWSALIVGKLQTPKYYPNQRTADLKVVKQPKFCWYDPNTWFKSYMQVGTVTFYKNAARIDVRVTTPYRDIAEFIDAVYACQIVVTSHKLYGLTIHYRSKESVV